MVIFLDIDGVLNQLQQNYYLDKQCISRLGRLCKKLHAQVVLTSNWRSGYSNVGQCSPQINILKQEFVKNDIKIIGRTPNLGDRTAEIREYILKHNIKEYLVLDDDRREFKSGLLKNTFIVNYKTGLTDADINKIIANK